VMAIPMLRGSMDTAVDDNLEPVGAGSRTERAAGLERRRRSHVP